MTNNNIYFIANWKMYGNLRSIDTINSVINLLKLKKYKKANVVYCPPYTLLNPFFKKTKNSRIKIGAQNCHTVKDYGAFTGSISAKMIRNLGSKFIIIGHSENRKQGETNKQINQKIKIALNEKLKVIFCIGETLKENKEGKTQSVLNSQIQKGLGKINNLNNIFFAYEPIWSIGTGIIPKTSDLQKQILNLRHYIQKKYKFKKLKILYGGSVNNKNISSLAQIKGINGFLIGAASQNSKKFIDIIKKTIN